MAQLTHLITHCTATPEGRIVTSDDIFRWHTSPVNMGGRGWKQVGYSDMIYIDGSLINLTPFNQDNTVDPWEVTNGAKGMNSKSRHVVYVGGLRYDYDSPIDEDTDMPGFMAADTRNEAQKYALEIYYKYMILRHPQILIAGHYDFSFKSCPCFSVSNFCREIGIAEKNIYKK